MDYEVESEVLENYFREDNNYEPETEKRDDQKEITDKDEAEDERHENSREQLSLNSGDTTECDYEEDEYPNEKTKWSAADEQMFKTYFSSPSWVDYSNSDSSECHNSDDEQTASRHYITKIQNTEINIHDQPFDISYENESDTEFIEKSEIEASEKSLKLGITNPDLL